MLRGATGRRLPNGRSLPQKSCHAVTGSPCWWSIAENCAVSDEITPEHIAAGLPGTADLMVLVGNSWWRCAYAARGGNWPLAAFYARRGRPPPPPLPIGAPRDAARPAAFETARPRPAVSADQAGRRA